MVDIWAVVSEADALAQAGPGARRETATAVTYGVGPAAMVVILDAGDRRDVNSVDTAATIRLVDAPASEGPIHGFVRVTGGCLYLGPLRRAGSPSSLTLATPMPDDILDRVRTVPRSSFPSIAWLTHLPHNAIAATRDFLTGWYADVPPVNSVAPVGLPPALASFYTVAAGRPEIYGRHNRIRPADELTPDGPLVEFASFAPSTPDPKVLSTFILQFVLYEASVSSPFTAVTRSAAGASPLLSRMTPVPLPPSMLASAPTRYYVAPGLVASATDQSLHLGARHRSALRSAAAPGWDSFNG